MHQALEGPFRPLAAVDPRGAEEHHGVLNVLHAESAQGFEVLGQNPDRAGFFAFEKIGIEIRKGLHPAIIEGQ